MSHYGDPSFPCSIQSIYEDIVLIAEFICLVDMSTRLNEPIQIAYLDILQ
jgi:hypothetical protein